MKNKLQLLFLHLPCGELCEVVNGAWIEEESWALKAIHQSHGQSACTARWSPSVACLGLVTLTSRGNGPNGMLGGTASLVATDGQHARPTRLTCGPEVSIPVSADAMQMGGAVSLRYLRVRTSEHHCMKSPVLLIVS